MALATSFIPVISGHVDFLAPLVVSASLATILVPCLTLSAVSTIPTLSIGNIPRRISSILKLVAAALLLGSVSLFANTLSKNSFLLLAAVSLLIAAAQSVYTLAIAVLVRIGDHKLITRSRFANNSISFALSVLVATQGGSWEGFALAGAAGFLSPTIFLRSSSEFRMLLCNGLKLGFTKEPETETLSSALARNIKVISVSSLSTVWSQLPSAMTPLLGPLIPAWAITIRFSAGLETLAGNVIGPILDIDRSRAIRDRNFVEMAHFRRFCLFLGVGIGILGGLASIEVLNLIHLIDYRTVDGMIASAILMALVLSQSVSAVSTQYLILLGGISEKFALDFFKGVVFSTLLIFTNIRIQALTFAIGLAIWATWQYLAILRRTSEFD